MIGFDIGGTKCAVSIGIEKNGCLEIKDKRIMPTDLSVSPYEMLDRMCAAAEELESAENFDVIGISCGGPLDSRRGIILSPPNLPGWDEIRVVEYLEKRFGCRAYLQNDANACAVAEWKYGAGKGLNNVVFLTFGTGLGAGLILNGKLYSGATDTGRVRKIRLIRGILLGRRHCQFRQDLRPRGVPIGKMRFVLQKCGVFAENQRKGNSRTRTGRRCRCKESL